MRRSSLICLIALTPFPLFADGHDDALARLEAGTVAMTENLLNFYEARVPELAEVRPDMAWDDEFRTAGQCFIDGLRADRGDTAIATYLAALEEYAVIEVGEFTDLTDKMPDALADYEVIELSTNCGMVQISRARMQASGLQDAIQAEGVMDRIIAPGE